MTSTLVFDVETFPDPNLVNRLAPPVGVPPDSDLYNLWMATTPPFCRIATIGCLSLRDGTIQLRFFDGITQEGRNQERASLLGFWQLAKLHDRFVTFNGKAFDIPLLEFRSRLHRVNIGSRINTHPFTDPDVGGHYDLLRSCYGGPGKGCTLGNLAAALGITDEDSGSGADVRHWVANGQIERLHAYNYNDLRMTAIAFELVHGGELASAFTELPTWKGIARVNRQGGMLWEVRGAEG